MLGDGIVSFGVNPVPAAADFRKVKAAPKIGSSMSILSLISIAALVNETSPDSLRIGTLISPSARRTPLSR